MITERMRTVRPRASPATRLTWQTKKRNIATRSKTSVIMSYLAAYLRYFGVLFFGKGHFVAKVPSKASVSSARTKMRKAAPRELPGRKASTMSARLRMKRVKVNKSAKYFFIS